MQSFSSITWSLTLLLTCGLNPCLFVRGQCLSVKDDLSLATDTDLTGIQDFNFDLFREVVSKSNTGNFIFSPYSVWNALAIAYFGSAQRTQRQFEAVLRVQDKISTLRKWRELEYLYSHRPEMSVNNTFVLSNRAYFDLEVRLRYCMEDILHNELRQLDFTNDAFGAAEKINEFVRNTTRGHIDRLVSPQDIIHAHMVLVNAAYFKGIWASTFEPENTKSRPFTPFSGEPRNVPMMAQHGRFKYGFDDDMKTEVLELPYMGDVISMYLFLPYTEDAAAFNNLLQNLTYTNVDALFNKMFLTQMHVFLPKFSLETIIEDELIQALTRMGLTDAFTTGKANFTDFSLNPNIKLDHGIHKAFIDVNEEGTEAGAATAFIANKIGGNSNFNCNRPFIFAIREKITNNLLFIGVVRSLPQGKGQTTTTGVKSTRPQKPQTVPQINPILHVIPTSSIPSPETSEEQQSFPFESQVRRENFFQVFPDPGDQ